MESLFVSVLMAAYYGYIGLIFRFGVATFKFHAFTFSALISEVAGMSRGSPRATRWHSRTAEALFETNLTSRFRNTPNNWLNLKYFLCSCYIFN